MVRPRRREFPPASAHAGPDASFTLRRRNKWASADEMYERFKVDRGRKDHWAMYGCPAKIPVVFIPDPNLPALPAAPTAAALKLLFPIVLTPFGIAAVIVLLALRGDDGRTEIIIGMVVLVMLLNLVTMLFARKIMVGATIVVLQILGGVLGILQAGLAVQIILRGLRDLKIIGE